MAIRTKDIPFWAAGKSERMSKMKGRAMARDGGLETKTFEELLPPEKDELLKRVAILLGVIKPSE